MERPSMSLAVRIRAHGGPEQLRAEMVELAGPGPGEVRVRHTAIGVNYSDINLRRGGFYPGHHPVMPLILGNEAAGVVEALGEGAAGFTPGERVAYCGMSGGVFENTGAYAEQRNVPQERLLKIPDGVSDREAAAMLVKGYTACQIVERIFPPRSGDVILIHAAASGVGLILTQWCKHLGATVIGTVGNREKAEVFRRYGGDHAILYRETSFVPSVKALAPGGVSAVFDGVGKDTFMASLDCIRPFGMAVNYGNASGNVPPLDIVLLAMKGSLSVARPGLHIYTGDLENLRTGAATLFELVRTGALKIEISRTFPLQDAAEAHRAIESASTTGSILLIP
jgi:NADPH2:quinone reductase